MRNGYQKHTKAMTREFWKRTLNQPISHINPIHPMTTTPKPSFSYFDGQRDYLARVACKDFALIAADTGTGKTLFALSLIQAKLAALPRPLAGEGRGEGADSFSGRALIIAPQST